MNKRNQITAEELVLLRRRNEYMNELNALRPEDYGWGGALQGGAAGAVAGAAIGTEILPGWGTAIGAAGGAIVMATAGHFAEEENIAAQEEQEKIVMSQQAQEKFWGDSSNIQSGNWSPTMMAQDGGPIQGQVNTPPQAYAGQSHQGPDGGIPVDKLGNPAAKNMGQPIALVEDGEVSYKGYIFSDKLKGDDGKTFASRAKKVMGKYKKRLGKNFEHDDAMAQEAMGLEMDTIAQENELSRMLKEGTFKGLDEYCGGGRLKKKGAGGILGDLAEAAIETEKSMFGDDLSVSGYLFEGNPTAARPVEEMAYGGNIRVSPTNAEIASSVKMGERAIDDVPASSGFGGMGAITAGIGMAADAYNMYDQARQSADSSINDMRVQKGMWDTQMQHRIQSMGIEDPNYAMREYADGGPVGSGQYGIFNMLTPEQRQGFTEAKKMALLAQGSRTSHITKMDQRNPVTNISKTNNELADVAEIKERSTENYRKQIPYEPQSNLWGYLPGATNALRGMFEPAEVIDAGDYTLTPNVSARQYRSGEAEKDAQRAAYNRLRAYNPASPTANAAQRIAVDVAQQEQIAMGRERAFNINEQLRGKADAENRAIMARNAQTRMAVRDLNDQARAAKSGMLTTGLEQMVQQTQGQMQENATNKLIDSMYPQYEDVEVFSGTNIPVNANDVFVQETIAEMSDSRAERKAKKQAEKDAEVNKRILSGFGNTDGRDPDQDAIIPTTMDPRAGIVAGKISEASTESGKITTLPEVEITEEAPPEIFPGKEDPITSETEVTDTVIDNIIQSESAGDPSAKNTKSSAGGLGQFIDSTWLEMMKEHRSDLTEGKTDAEIIKMKTDPDLSREMTTEYAKKNAKSLRSRGLDVTPGNIYLAHHFGIGGASKLLKSPPDATALSVVGESIIKANPYMKGKTVGEILDIINKKMEA